MTLTYPLALLALLLIPAGVLASRLARARRRKFAVRLPTTSTLAALIPQESASRRLLAPIFLSLAVLSLAVALSKPKVTVQVPVERASVMLVVDASGSMRASDVAPTRLDAARSAVGTFLDQVPDQMRVGLLTYSSAVESVQAPTTDRDQIRDAANQIAADGGTATGDALTEAIAKLKDGDEKNPPPSAILLLSDGMTSQGSDPLAAAQAAKAAGVPISTVALGTANGVVELQPGITRAVPPDPETLKEIASISGGKAFSADDAGELDDVYKKMGSQLGTKPEQREVTAGATGFAAAFLAAGLLFALRRRDRLT